MYWQNTCSPQLRSIRLRKARRMPDEQAEDERVGTVETAFKIDVVNPWSRRCVVAVQGQVFSGKYGKTAWNETLHSVQSYIFQCYKCTRDWTYLSFLQPGRKYCRQRAEWFPVRVSVDLIANRHQWPLPEVSSWYSWVTLEENGQNKQLKARKLQSYPLPETMLQTLSLKLIWQKNR